MVPGLQNMSHLSPITVAMHELHSPQGGVGPPAATTLNSFSQSSKEVSRTVSHHLEQALAPVSFGSCILHSGLGGVGAAHFRPQDLSVGRAGASGRRDAGQAEMAGDCSRVRNPERMGSVILSGLTHCARPARWPWRWLVCMEPRQLWD